MTVFLKGDSPRITHHNMRRAAQQCRLRWNRQAKQVYKEKNTKNALIMFKKLYLKYPKNNQIAYYIGSCLLNENNFESALNYFKTCISSDQNTNKNVYLFMAICYKALGRFKQAIEILQIGCQKNHKFKDAFFYKGKIHIKRRQYQQASISFRKCIKIDAGDDLAKFFLAESLRNLGLNEQALQKFDSLQKESPKLYVKSTIKKIQILLQQKRLKQAAFQFKKTQIQKVESLQLTFLKGIYEYQVSNYNDSSTFLQLTLSSNIGQPYMSKALQLLLQIKIKEKDFLGAEHLISRSKFMNMAQEKLILYYKLVQGINDLIKRRLNDAEQKLQYVYANSLHQKSDSEKFIQEVGSSFYAFCLFSLEKYQKALEIYRKNRNKKQISKKVEDYNYLVCQGIVFHKKKQYMLAQQKFKQASKLFQNRTQPFFLICVNIVQQNRDSFNQEQVKKRVYNTLLKYFKSTEKIEPQNPLFLFYQSLVLLFEGQDACSTIQKAISFSEQQISEYFFIQALALSLNGQTLKGLESINKAIELDHSIPEFYKQRSKYYYVLERYEDAVSDIVNTLQQNNDQEAKLLLTFYYYMTQQYSLSLDLLKEVSQHCVEDKFRQFEMALNFRLHKYDKCGAAGQIVNSIVKRKLLDLQYIDKVIEQQINQRQNYSQFTVYFFHLLLSSYFFYNNQLDSCLEQLFGALEQIQLSAENQQTYATLSQLMLNQIKFNISITSLLKQSNSSNENNGKMYADTVKYIQMFLNETEDTDFIKVMNSLLEYIQKSWSTKASQQKFKYIELYQQIPKVSNDFPQVTIFLNQSHAFKTKFMVVYPQKLKFNISPQFDESFLFNFDVDKIESKLCPPWYKLHQGQIFFTDKIRNESVLISETEKPLTPSLIMSPTPMPQNLREKFKLDDAIEKKIQKLIQINKKKASNKQLQEGKVVI